MVSVILDSLKVTKYQTTMVVTYKPENHHVVYFIRMRSDLDIIFKKISVEAGLKYIGWCTTSHYSHYDFILNIVMVCM